VEPIQLDRSSTVDKVVDALKDGLYRGQLAPGTLLREQALMSSLCVSRSTVREALQVLAAEGLLVRLPNRGIAVRQLTRAEVDDVFLAREVLEIAGIRSAENRLTESRWGEAMAELAAALEGYAATADKTDPAAANEAHLHFHACIVGLIGSRSLVDAAHSLNSRIRVAVASVDRTTDDLPQQVDEHRKLLDLLRAGRFQDAETILAAHLVRARAYVLTDIP
jgi:DNA-binding GntR family transcriptional regulator